MKHALPLIVLVVVWTPIAGRAQPVSDPTTIALRPAAEPRPALRYRLVPERRAQVAGNAAVFYHRAIQMVFERRARFSAPDQGKDRVRGAPLYDRIHDWITDPVDKLPREDARKVLDAFDDPLKECELGAIRSSCDWEFDLRSDGISMRLPDIQEMRFLAQLVALQARAAIVDGKTDEAVHWIVTGLVMGRHVSEGPVVIQALVGVSIDVIMLRRIEDLIQVPGAPNLVWALADAPRPFIDMRRCLEGERYLLEKEFPDLTELENGPWTLDRTRKFTDELERKLFALTSSDPGSSRGNGNAALTRRIGIAAMAAKVYPEAKKALIEAGEPESTVAAMPVVQVATLYTVREYHRLLDDSYKWLNVPYWQSSGKVDRPVMQKAEEKLANPMLWMFYTLMPALNQVRLASLRLDRHLDALQCIEAVRMYAAEHDGALPASLDLIKDAPVPMDPLTGKRFAYTQDGDSATLVAPAPAGAPKNPTFTLRYILKFAH